MEFVDNYVFKEKRFSIGRELTTGKCYLSIPVSNGIVDYEEYYEIEEELLSECPDNMEQLCILASLCRRQKNNDRLIIMPGTKRGIAV